MIRPSNHLLEVFMCMDPIDFRKGINGLAAFVEAGLELDPFSEKLFVFTNKRRDKIKILYWERNGFCLWQKRLEKDRFHWLRPSGKGVSIITGEQLNWLLDGYDLKVMTPHEKLQFSSIF